jgi:hypothetical protein
MVNRKSEQLASILTGAEIIRRKKSRYYLIRKRNNGNRKNENRK